VEKNQKYFIPAQNAEFQSTAQQDILVIVIEEATATSLPIFLLCQKSEKSSREKLPEREISASQTIKRHSDYSIR
jgi:hypothetical protein